MALLYRAIWADSRDDLITVGRTTFESWLSSKKLGITLPESGDASAGGAEVSVAEVDDGEVWALRIRLGEERAVAGGAERWTTTAHWMTDGDQTWVWVDLEWVSDNAFARQPETVAPNLIGLLLDADESGGPVERLSSNPARVAEADVKALIETIYSPGRSIPVVVFTPDARISPQDYSKRVKEVARRLAGCTDVRMLTTESQLAFDAAQRDTSMSVFDGAARVYLPGIDPSNPMPWRHQYVRAHLLSDRPRTAAARIGQLVLPRMVAQRPPALYRTHVKQLLDQSVGEQTDWEAIALELDERLTGLKSDVEGLREEKDLALMEALDSEREAADALHRLDALRAELRIQGQVPELIEQDAAEAPLVTSCADAVELAATLKNLVVHPDAPRDIDRMDQSPNAELWGQRVWSHLQSLDAYAAAKGPGFNVWCETSGHPRAIASKFIAMTESKTVRTNESLRKHRDLPVDKAISPSGIIEMLAHIKSIQGGGMQIPRIYFHDDTKGKTGKVHIGFIGPHDLVPNTLS
jgi:hypothetical protein